MSETPPIIPSVNTSPLPPNREMMRLRDMLDEQGIEYNKSETDAEKFTYWEREGRCWGYCVDCIGDTSLITIDITPEQAIAATCELWNTRSDYAVQAANERKVDERDTVPVTKYKMALDDARKSNMDAERWERIARDHQSKCESLKQTNADLRRIIAEMDAATVGVGTCRLVDNDSGPDMHCTACGGEVDDEYRYFMDSWGYSRCPHCGARIIEEETEQ